MTQTRGYGIMNHTFKEYAPVIKNWNPGRQKGALVSMNSGKATTYAMMGIESRGTLLIDPGTEVYEGMIIGENSRTNDITVNITKGKNLTNVRAAGSDEKAWINTPTHFSLEQSLEFLNEDELCEVTPENIRLRKKILNTNAREKAAKRRRAQSKK
jgi:GTP-binding protein